MLANFFFLFSHYSGLNSIYSNIKNKSPNFKILTYHQIEGKNFNQQMKLLVSLNYKFISQNAIDEKNRKIFTNSSNNVLITFDDGYESIYHENFPIFKKYGIASTIFLVSGLISKDKLVWTDKLKGIIQNSNSKIIFFLKRKLDLNLLKQEEAYSIISSELHKLSTLERDDILKSMENEYLDSKLHINSNQKFLNWDQVKEMSNYGIVFGAHTVNHAFLTNDAKKDLDYEISKSKETIEKKLGITVLHFAYPHGYFSNNVIKSLKENEYMTACSGLRGFNYNIDKYALKRISISPQDSIYKFRTKLSGLWSDLLLLKDKILGI